MAKVFSREYHERGNGRVKNGWGLSYCNCSVFLERNWICLFPTVHEMAHDRLKCSRTVGEGVAGMTLSSGGFPAGIAKGFFMVIAEPTGNLLCFYGSDEAGHVGHFDGFWFTDDSPGVAPKSANVGEIERDSFLMFLVEVLT